jgi:hypothetical protein
MTIHRVRLGHDLLQDARDDKPLTLLSIALMLVYVLLPLGLLCIAIWSFFLALQARDAPAWNSFWQTLDGEGPAIMLAVVGPAVFATLDGMRVLQRTARRYALLGDDRWAPALDVQPAPLTAGELGQDALDFGAVYAPKANMAILYMVAGVVLVAFGGGTAWGFIWLAQQNWPPPESDELLAIAIILLVSAIVVGCVAWGIWAIWRGVRLNGGVHLTGDEAALHIYIRRGRERARIAWHEIRALAAQRPTTGSDRTTYYLDTGDCVLTWVESSFDPSAVRVQHALLRRAVVTRTGVALRDVTPVFTRTPAELRDLVPQRRNARIQLGGGARVEVDDSVPTEADRAIWQPMRALQHRLAMAGGILLATAILLEVVAFVAQHLLGG